MHKGLKNQVLQTLREMPSTRDSDALLTLELWKRFYHLPDPVNQVKLLEIMRWASQDTIGRIRQQIQNRDGLYPPTSETVAKERGMNIERWRSFLGYDNQLDTL